MPRTVLALIGDSLQLLALGMRSHTHLAAEILFLRKQLSFHAERRRKLRRLDDATRLTVLRQNSIGAVCVETSRWDVALFLPFRCNKVQQTAARGGTKRKSKIAKFYAGCGAL